MKKSIEEKNKTIHFIEKWFIIGIILFIVIQLGGGIIIHMTVPKEYQESIEKHDNDYIGHWYNGTFFINMTVHENFESQEKYDKMKEEYRNDTVSNICEVAGGVSILAALAFIGIAAFKEKKMKLLEGHTPLFIILGGVFLLLHKIIEEIDLFIDVSYYKKYSTGFLSTASYYPQFHFIFILAISLIALGLVLRQKQRKDLKLSTKNNETIIKVISTITLVGGLSFILYRFGVRIYELIMVLNNSNFSIRIPFYYYMLELPRYFASTNDSYIKLVILRLIKDLPTFIASVITLILFVKIFLSSIKGKIISDENKKRYKIILISLIIASLFLNIVGIFEVKLYNAEFLYQYKEATYTIAVRSLTEPLFFGFFIYLFKHYVDLAYLTNKSRKSKDE